MNYSDMVLFQPYAGDNTPQAYDTGLHQDSLIKSLLQKRVYDQIISAFGDADFISGGGGNPGGDGGGTDTPAPAPEPTANPEVINAVLSEIAGRNDGYDASIAGPDGYGLYGNPSGFAGGGVMGNGIGGGGGGK